MKEELHRVNVKCSKCNEDMQVTLNAQNYDYFMKLQCYFTCNACLRERGCKIALERDTAIEFVAEDVEMR